MLGLSSIFLFNFFLHVICNSTKTSANSSGEQHCYSSFKVCVERGKKNELYNVMLLVNFSRELNWRWDLCNGSCHIKLCSEPVLLRPQLTHCILWLFQYNPDNTLKLGQLHKLLWCAGDWSTLWATLANADPPPATHPQRSPIKDSVHVDVVPDQITVRTFVGGKVIKMDIFNP